MKRVSARRATTICLFLVVVLVALFGIATLASASPAVGGTATTVAAGTATTVAADGGGGFATGYIVLIVVAVVLVAGLVMWLSRGRKKS
jgi:hypothetical protein